MSWADAVPNLLIGLREGLEAGLIVSLLLAALRKGDSLGQRRSAAPIWFGVLGAVSVAISFAAVVTLSTDALSSRTQEVASGTLSVLAVFLVTAMVFWMRRTAVSLSGELRGRVDAALQVGAGALAITAFLAVSREGLETTLFLWTAVRASGQTSAPLLGAALGLAAAIVLCCLLYRRAVRINLGVFFSRTAIALIVIAAGVLSYGLGDLQGARVLPGTHWTAFDLSAHLDPGSWWVAIVSGVSELTPTMTVLQVVAWLTYLAVVLPLFVRAGRPVAASAPPAVPVAPPASPLAAVPTAAPVSAGRRTAAVGRHPRWVAAGLIVGPVLVAGAVIVALPGADATHRTALTVSRNGCAAAWKSASSGVQTFAMDNTSDRVAEIHLVNGTGAVLGEIETLGPATTSDLTATLSPGIYSFRCYLSGRPVSRSADVIVTQAALTLSAGSSSGAQNAPSAAVLGVKTDDLIPANKAYQRYVGPQLIALTVALTALGADLAHQDLPAARRDWLTAQLVWERVGASYNSFGDAGLAVDGLPVGLPAGPADPAFTGLHRLEYGLWHQQPVAALQPVLTATLQAVAALAGQLSSSDVAGDPTTLPLRAHEILEDAQRDHLSGIDDQGSGATYPMVDADAQVTAVVLAELEPLLAVRAPELAPLAARQLDVLRRALAATHHGQGWLAPAQTPLALRQSVNAALGAVLETLSRVPDLLEVRAGD